MSTEPGYHSIVQHYEACLERHGDTHAGVDWPNAQDADKRYRVMLDVVRESESPVTLLDFGCGAAHLVEHMQKRQLSHIAYAGLDASPKFTALCQHKYPALPFYCMDVLQDHAALPQFDYVVMNGVFTEKRALSQDAMWAYFTQLITLMFAKTQRGLAFNVMSKAVDWERDDLFHLSADVLINFLTKNLTRNFVIRNDYGLYEYTTYIYR
jgi:SAM-dependent methyltransferase